VFSPLHVWLFLCPPRPATMSIFPDSISRERLPAYATTAFCVGALVILVDRQFLRPLRSPLKDLPGPPLDLSTNTKASSENSKKPQATGDTRLFGHQGRWMGRRTNSYEVHEEWAKVYGKTFVYRGFMQVRWFCRQ
jgi:hypothetical protein